MCVVACNGCSTALPNTARGIGTQRANVRINEIMDPNNIQRHQYNTNPDSSYGAVFQLDTLVDVIPGLIYPAWLEVCARLPCGYIIMAPPVLAVSLVGGARLLLRSFLTPAVSCPRATGMYIRAAFCIVCVAPYIRCVWCCWAASCVQRGGESYVQGWVECQSKAVRGRVAAGTVTWGSRSRGSLSLRPKQSRQSHAARPTLTCATPSPSILRRFSSLAGGARAEPERPHPAHGGAGLRFDAGADVPEGVQLEAHAGGARGGAGDLRQDGAFGTPLPRCGGTPQKTDWLVHFFWAFFCDTSVRHTWVSRCRIYVWERSSCHLRNGVWAGCFRGFVPSYSLFAQRGVGAPRGLGWGVELLLSLWLAHTARGLG